jgi:hypothetical protein
MPSNAALHLLLLCFNGHGLSERKLLNDKEQDIPDRSQCRYWSFYPRQSCGAEGFDSRRRTYAEARLWRHQEVGGRYDRVSNTPFPNRTAAANCAAGSAFLSSKADGLRHVVGAGFARLPFFRGNPMHYFNSTANSGDTILISNRRRQAGTSRASF